MVVRKLAGDQVTPCVRLTAIIGVEKIVSCAGTPRVCIDVAFFIGLRWYYPLERSRGMWPQLRKNCQRRFASIRPVFVLNICLLDGWESVPEYQWPGCVRDGCVYFLTCRINCSDDKTEVYCQLKMREEKKWGRDSEDDIRFTKKWSRKHISLSNDELGINW